MDLNNLTHKNQEFIHIATKQLIQDGKTDSEIRTILQDILPSIEEKQKHGIPARSFLGAPTTWAAQFSKNAEETSQEKQEAKNTNPWLMWTDASLFWLGILGVVMGIMALTGSNTQTYGALTLLVVGLGGGAILYATYHFVYRHMGKEKSKRPNIWKSILILAVLMLTWLILFGATSYLPQSFNPQLPPVVMLIIGSIALAIRHFLKKKYNILSAMSAQASSKY